MTYASGSVIHSQGYLTMFHLISGNLPLGSIFSTYPDINQNVQITYPITIVEPLEETSSIITQGTAGKFETDLVVPVTFFADNPNNLDNNAGAVINAIKNNLSSLAASGFKLLRIEPTMNEVNILDNNKKEYAKGINIVMRYRE